MRLNTKDKSRFLHSGTAKDAVPQVGVTNLHLVGLENEWA